MGGRRTTRNLPLITNEYGGEDGRRDLSNLRLDQPFRPARVRQSPADIFLAGLIDQIGVIGVVSQFGEDSLLSTGRDRSQGALVDGVPDLHSDP